VGTLERMALLVPAMRAGGDKRDRRKRWSRMRCRALSRESQSVAFRAQAVAEEKSSTSY
jgi:hypothetical protein